MADDLIYDLPSWEPRKSFTSKEKSKEEMKAGKAVGQTTVAFDLAY